VYCAARRAAESSRGWQNRARFAVP